MSWKTFKKRNISRKEDSFLRASKAKYYSTAFYPCYVVHKRPKLATETTQLVVGAILNQFGQLDRL